MSIGSFARHITINQNRSLALSQGQQFVLLTMSFIFKPVARVFLLFLLLGCITSLGLASISCLDENGSPVDSWIALKAGNSFDYYFLSGSTFVKSQYELSQSSDGMIMRTAQQAYSKPTEPYAVAIYNDEPPGVNPASSSFAHAKGILMTTATQGFWLVHSMPLWPANIGGGNGNPGPFPSKDYGQSLMCITVSATNADLIAESLGKVERVARYSGFISPSIASSFPSLNFLATMTAPVKSLATSKISSFQSVAGVPYFMLAKSGSWGLDLWDDLVAPYFQTSLDCETWRKGVGGRISSICSKNPTAPGPYKTQPFDVYTVSQVQMPNYGDVWDGMQDHSKWAVAHPAQSPSPQLPLICVGGINRMCSQEGRGGQATCFLSPSAWAAFQSVIALREDCYQVNPCAKASTASCYWCDAPVPTLPPAGYPKYKAQPAAVVPPPPPTPTQKRPTPAPSAPSPPTRSPRARPTKRPPTAEPSSSYETPEPTHDPTEAPAIGTEKNPTRAPRAKPTNRPTTPEPSNAQPSPAQASTPTAPRAGAGTVASKGAEPTLRPTRGDSSASASSGSSSSGSQAVPTSTVLLAVLGTLGAILIIVFLFFFRERFAVAMGLTRKAPLSAQSQPHHWRTSQGNDGPVYPALPRAGGGGTCIGLQAQAQTAASPKRVMNSPVDEIPSLSPPAPWARSSRSSEDFFERM